MVVGLDVVLADGTADPHRRHRPPGRRPRPHPAVRRLARARSASSPAPGCAPTRRPPHERRAAYGFADVRRRARRLPPHPAPRRHAGRAAALRRASSRRAATAPTARRACCSCSTRATRRSSTPPIDDRRPRSAPAPTASTIELVEHWLGHRNDVSALEALIREGLRRRHDGDRRRRGRGCRRSTTPPSPPSLAVAGTLARVGPPVARLHRRRLPLLHVRRQRRRPTASRTTTTVAAVGRRHARRARRTAAPLSHHHGVGLNRARFMRRGARRRARRARAR